MKEMTFRDIAERWKADKRPFVKVNSYSTYVLLLNKHLLPVFGDDTAIAESDVQAFALRKLEEGLSPKACRKWS